MERQTFTKKFEMPVPKSGATELFDGLEFPIAPDFQSELPSGELEDVYRACEEMLATVLALPGELEGRRLEGITAEFVL